MIETAKTASPKPKRQPYSLPLGANRKVTILVPADFSTEEARLIASWVSMLGVPPVVTMVFGSPIPLSDSSPTTHPGNGGNR